MSKWLIYLIGGMVIFGLAVFITHAALEAKFRQGKAEERQTCEIEKIEAYEQGLKLKETVDLEVKRLSVSDVDKLLAANDWMRDTGDR